MEFKHLKAAILHNAEESPSIYLAICAMQSLVDDVEDEADKEISQCPMGDDKLPTRLLWLCNTVLDIYHDNSEDMVRSRDRLQAAAGKLSEIAEKLKPLADISEQLALKNEALEAKEKELAAANGQKEAFDRLCEKITKAESDLAALKAFDVAAQQAQLTELNESIRQYEAAQTELTSALTAAKHNLDTARQTCESKERSLKELQEEADALNQKALSLQVAIDAQTEACHEASEKEAALTAEKQRLEQENTAANARLLELEQENTDYQAACLTPLLAKVEAARKLNAEKERDKEQAQQTLDRLLAEKTQIVQKISEIRNRQPGENAELEEKRAQLTFLSEEQTSLTSKLGDLQRQYQNLVDQLSGLQDRTFQLETKEIPQQQQSTDAEQARVTKLQQRLQGLQDDEQDAKKQSSDLERKIQEATKERNIYQSHYESLTADYSDKNKEINELKSKLDEMKDKTDAEKHAMFKQELEAAIKEQEDILSECAALEAQIPQIHEQTEKNRQRYEELKGKKDDAAETALEFERYVKELEPIITPGFCTRLAEDKVRLERLNQSREALHKSLARMEEILGKTPLEDETLLTQLNEVIPKLQTKLEQLQNDLTKCAQSIKLEERI